MSAEFVHLHVHTHFSLLDSSIRVGPMVKRAAELDMGAIAITDHANMFGALQMVNACKEHDVKPILGCEVNMVVGSPGQSNARADPELRDVHHLLLLASSQQGYQNLVRIVSRGWVDGLVRGVPRVDLDLIAEHNEGLVGLSACMGGYLAQRILHHGKGAGRDAMAQLRDSFTPGHFFAELQDHGFPEQAPLNQIITELAADLSLPIVASNDCHYMDPGEANAQQVLQCIGTSTSVEDMRRQHHNADSIHLASPDEMAHRFRHHPEAVKNTLRIAEMCAGQVNPFAAPKLPTFEVPRERTPEDHLEELSRQGLEQRFAAISSVVTEVDRKAYTKRLEHELQVINDMGFAGYFLIVQDFIVWAKEHHVPVGPGRGSGAGSLVAYALQITDIDPLPYGLLFERFLNPERVSMPDFDIDFCMDRRDLVIEYVREKYGRQSVGQIATFHQLKSRSVVRDVGRVMGMTAAEAGRIATLVPEPIQGKTVPIATALEQEPRLRGMQQEDPKVRGLLDTAQVLEDLTRHAGMHAAGVVISEGPLWDHVPVFCPEPDTYVTQYHKDDVEAAGLVKFDFLGLKTLTVIDYAIRLIQKRPPISNQERPQTPFDINRIPLDDPATYALLGSGETTNVFQLESSGMQRLFKQLRPDGFEDIIAAVALYRPGPLGSGMVEDFVQRKHGRVPVEYPHPSLEPILKDTYGVIVYQEQVMQIARKMAGYTLGGADLLRRAMGKKKASEMEKQKSIFLKGATGLGHSEADADRVFELMAYFAGYGFNKSHSAAYALLTYQTAYLKAHFPVEFMTATLTADRDKSDKVVRSIAEARAMGITVLSPDVNESEINFTVVYGREHERSTVVHGGDEQDSASTAKKKKRARRKNQPASMDGTLRDPMHPKIRFGLGGVKGIGDAALEAIFESRVDPESKQHRPFQDLFDFTSRVDLRRVSKSVVEALIRCGGFDAMHTPLEVHRAQAVAAMDMAVERGKTAARERDSGQTNLFGMLTAPTPPNPDGTGGTSTEAGAQPSGNRFPDCPPWGYREQLRIEKESLGFYVSGHPLDRFTGELKRLGTASTTSAGLSPDGHALTIAGSVEGYRERTTKAGQRMAFFSLEDPVGRMEVVVRPRVLSKNPELAEILASGQPMLLEAAVQKDGGAWANSGGNGGGNSGGSSDSTGETKLVLKDAKPLLETLQSQATAIHVQLSLDELLREATATRSTKQTLINLKSTLDKHPGTCPVTVELSTHLWRATFSPNALHVAATEELLADLEHLFGKKVCELR